MMAVATTRGRTPRLFPRFWITEGGGKGVTGACLCGGGVAVCKQTQKYVLMRATSSAVSSLRSCLCALASNSHDSSFDASLWVGCVHYTVAAAAVVVVTATNNCVESQ